MKIEIDRHWHQNAFVSKSWFKKGTLAKHRLYFYWQDKEFPCDEYGFRLPKNLENFESRYKKDKKKRFFVLEGLQLGDNFAIMKKLILLFYKIFLMIKYQFIILEDVILIVEHKYTY